VAERRISFTVPLVPPNLNHYKVPIWGQRRFAVTGPAKAFKEAIAIFARGAAVIGRQFQVEAIIYLGHKNKGDVDGFGKLILDGLAEAGVFQKANGRRPLVTPCQMSDAHVTDLILRKRRDADNPRTEFTIEAI